MKRILSNIRYYWRMWFWDRFNPHYLFNGEPKHWLLNVFFYKELNFAMHHLNFNYGHLNKDIRVATDGYICLNSGIAFLKLGIKSGDDYRKFIKYEKKLSEIRKSVREAMDISLHKALKSEHKQY